MKTKFCFCDVENTAQVLETWAVTERRAKDQLAFRLARGNLGLKRKIKARLVSKRAPELQPKSAKSAEQLQLW